MRLFSTLLGLSLALSAFADPSPPPKTAVEKLLKLPSLAKEILAAPEPEKEEIPILDKFSPKERSRFIGMLGEYKYFGERYGAVEAHLSDLHKNYVDPAKAEEVAKKNEKVLDLLQQPLKDLTSQISLMLKDGLEEVGMTKSGFAQSTLAPSSFKLMYYVDRKAYEANEKPVGEVEVRLSKTEKGLAIEIRAEVDGKDAEADGAEK
jgi:hypothetical protein